MPHLMPPSSKPEGPAPRQPAFKNYKPKFSYFLERIRGLMFIDTSAFIEIMTGGQTHTALLATLSKSKLRPITSHHVRAAVVRHLCDTRRMRTGRDAPEHREITATNELFDRAMMLLHCTEKPATKDAMIAAGYFLCDFPHLTQEQALTAAISVVSRREILTRCSDLAAINFRQIGLR